MWKAGRSNSKVKYQKEAEVVANDLFKVLGEFVSRKPLTKLLAKHIEKIVKNALTPREWLIMNEVRKANLPWQEQIGYHCNCGNKQDPRPCIDHGKKEK